MTSIAVEQHVAYALRNTRKLTWPFSHFYAENVFPSDFYAEIQRFLSETREYKGTDYANRAFATDSAIPGLEFMKSKEFLQNILSIFREEASETLGGQKTSFHIDIRLVRDQQEYKIGPHTDAKWKLISLLFYLPSNNDYLNYGTSLFIPKERDFTCEGGPHYPFEGFDKVYTAPFAPNSCLGFWKTSNSFHGVEPIPVQFDRNVLLYNVYKKE
jgi:hypothetical protein